MIIQLTIDELDELFNCELADVEAELLTLI